GKHIRRKDVAKTKRPKSFSPPLNFLFISCSRLRARTRQLQRDNEFLFVISSRLNRAEPIPVTPLVIRELPSEFRTSSARNESGSCFNMGNPIRHAAHATVSSNTLTEEIDNPSGRVRFRHKQLTLP